MVPSNILGRFLFLFSAACYFFVPVLALPEAATERTVNNTNHAGTLATERTVNNTNKVGALATAIKSLLFPVPTGRPRKQTIMDTIHDLPEAYQWCLHNDYRTIREDGEFAGMFFKSFFTVSVDDFCKQNWNWHHPRMAPFQNHGLNEMIFWRLECCVGMRDYNNQTAKIQAANWLKKVCPTDFSAEQYYKATRFRPHRFVHGHFPGYAFVGCVHRHTNL